MRAGLVLLALGVAVLVAPASSELGASRVAERYAERVIAAGLLELPPTPAPGPELVSFVRDGRRRAEVGLLDVATALPGPLLSRVLGSDATLSSVRSAAGVLVPAILFAALGAVFFARLHRRSGLALSAGNALFATLALLLSTGLIMGARRADASLFAALALLLLVDQLGEIDQLGKIDQLGEGEASTVPRLRHFLQIGLLGATVVLAQPSYAGAVIALGLLELLRQRASGALFGRALLVGAPLFAALAVVRIWDQTVAIPPAASRAPVQALYGLLLSPGRSLFIYSPLALLGVIGFSRLWARDRGRAQAIAVTIAASLVGIAGRADWHGDPSFGPPLVLPLLPLFVEPAALLLESRRRARFAFACAVLVGVLVQGLGLGVRAEGWPRLMAEVRAATGAPGWFLAPAADIEFVPQLSPIVGHALLLGAALGRPMASLPPFALVVASDQADIAKGQAIETIWPGVWTHFDKAQCRPNLMLTEAPRSVVRVQLALAFVLIAAGIGWMVRTGAGARRSRWQRG